MWNWQLVRNLQKPISNAVWRLQAGEKLIHDNVLRRDMVKTKSAGNLQKWGLQKDEEIPRFWATQFHTHFEGSLPIKPTKGGVSQLSNFSVQFVGQAQTHLPSHPEKRGTAAVLWIKVQKMKAFLHRKIGLKQVEFAEAYQSCSLGVWGFVIVALWWPENWIPKQKRSNSHFDQWAVRFIGRASMPVE